MCNVRSVYRSSYVQTLPGGALVRVVQAGSGTGNPLVRPAAVCVYPSLPGWHVLQVRASRLFLSRCFCVGPKYRREDGPEALEPPLGGRETD